MERNSGGGKGGREKEGDVKRKTVPELSTKEIMV